MTTHTWWASAIFATGALWYFLSVKAYGWAITAALGALFFAALAIVLHRRKDVTERKSETPSTESSNDQEPMADLVLTPINDQGSNIRVETEKGFFVQARFHLKSTADAEVLDVDLKYCFGSRAYYTSMGKDVLVNGINIGTDNFDKIQSAIHFKRGQSHRITVIRRFPKKPYVEDYGTVTVSVETNFLAHPEFQRKEWTFALSAGGALLLPKTA